MAIFISYHRGGMVVGSAGVINAGSLTVMALENETFRALNINSFNPNATFFLSEDGQITVNGKINASGGVDLRAAYVSISRINSTNPSSTNTNNTIPSTTVTGANLFNEVVNLTGNEANEATVLKAVIDASGDISIKAVKELKFINAEINSSNGKVELDAIGDNNGTLDLQGSSVTAEKALKIEVGNTITIDSTSSVISRNDVINMHTEKSDINNYGTISAKNILNVTAGKSSSVSANLTNGGNIQSPDGTIKLVAKNNITNSSTIQAKGQIAFDVGDTLSNNGIINSTGSNVQAHIGRDFNNIGVPDSPNSSTLKGGIIEASGNVQVDYNLPNGMSAISTSSVPFGILNSGRIRANGNTAPGSKDDGTINMETGRGNIWLTSSYNIENTTTGQMIAGRQITLNARDFLDNYGLIQGVTYLDIKSIMGYVYNHTSGKIIATGGNIDLSSGQANLQIKDDDGTKKELYRKFTPIIIEGLVEATSDDNENNHTKEGNIKITSYLGDIYINGGTLETKPELGTNKEVKAVAGNVILDAAQNITIGFQTESARADDPTTDGVNLNNDIEREYYKPKVDTSGNIVSGNGAQISSTNIMLTSGSGANNTISLSEKSNLAASDSVELNGGGNVTVGAGASVILGGSLQLQGNNISVSGVQRSGNPTEPLKVEANGAGGTGSAINSLNLNIAGDVLFNTLNVNTADVNVSGDLQIKQLHVADQAHFTSNNTMLGVYGEATEPRGDQSDALYRDMGNGSDSWMGINIKSDGYQITNGTEIQNAFAGGTEDPVQMSSKLVDVDPQETLVENYGDVTGNFGRFDLVDDSARPSGGIESTDQGSQTVLKQDENGLHIETSDNKVDNGSQIEAGDNKVDNGTQIEAGDNKVDNGTQIEAGDNKVDNGTQIEAGDDKNDQGTQIEAGDDKGDQGTQIEAGDDKDDQGSQIEAGDDKEDEDSQLEAGDKKKDKSKRDKKDKREKQKKDK